MVQSIFEEMGGRYERQGEYILVHVVGVPPGGAYAHHQGAGAGRLDERPCGGENARHSHFYQWTTGLFRADHRRAYCGAGSPTGVHTLGAGLHRFPAVARAVLGASGGKEAGLIWHS